MEMILMIRPYSWMAWVSWFWRAEAWSLATRVEAGKVAVADRGRHSEHLVPPVGEAVGSDLVAEQLGCLAGGVGEGEPPEPGSTAAGTVTVESLVGEVADAGREPQAAEVEEAEHEVGVAGGVGCVFLDVEVGFVVEDGVKDGGSISGLVRSASPVASGSAVSVLGAYRSRSVDRQTLALCLLWACVDGDDWPLTGIGRCTAIARRRLTDLRCGLAG
jgi:hypothetical protein